MTDADLLAKLRFPARPARFGGAAGACPSLGAFLVALGVALGAAAVARKLVGGTRYAHLTPWATSVASLTAGTLAYLTLARRCPAV